MNIRKKTIMSIIVIFFINAFLVLTYYRSYLATQYDEVTRDLIRAYEIKLEELRPTLESSDNLYNNIVEIVDQKDAIITVKDKLGNLLYSNNKGSIENLYVATSIIEVNKETFIITYCDDNIASIPNYLIIQNFMIFQVVLGIVIIAFGLMFANSKLLNPIVKLQKDVRNYKDGIKPSKRKVKTSIDEVQNTFVELVDNLEEERQKQNRIIASISHDIKTPLTSIIGYSNRLNTAKLNDVTKNKYVEKIYNKSLVMKELIEEFDDYLSCNIEDNLKRQPIKISDLVEMLKSDYLDELEEKNIDFEIKTNCLKSYIYVDVFKMRRVFSNIITNSVNHLEKAKKHISIKITKKKKNILFSISDNGTGVKKEHLDKIFEPLFTTDPSRKISGLGLSICKQIIESHDGKISATNNIEGGLKITFTLKEGKNEKN
ncbi:MAG: HAMP domain-containing sensor histidine kinase [Bacilli bacterium]|nr:HAMP domain-containing sensor histidine kinase [Bacilli bacterium]